MTAFTRLLPFCLRMDPAITKGAGRFAVSLTLRWSSRWKVPSPRQRYVHAKQKERVVRTVSAACPLSPWRDLFSTRWVRHLQKSRRMCSRTILPPLLQRYTSVSVTPKVQPCCFNFNQAPTFAGAYQIHLGCLTCRQSAANHFGSQRDISGELSELFRRQDFKLRASRPSSRMAPMNVFGGRNEMHIHK
jgi:hypothetical protein